MPAAVARYLADTSALSRLDHREVDAERAPLIEAGQVATCGMIELEVLFSARNPDDYVRRRRQLRDGFEHLAMPDEVWQRAIEVQSVLHYDHEYDLIASVTGQEVRWIVPRGTAAGR